MRCRPRVSMILEATRPPRSPKGLLGSPETVPTGSAREGTKPRNGPVGGCIGPVAAKGGPPPQLTESPKAARGILTRKTCRRHGGGPSRSRRVIWRTGRALITVPLPFSCTSVGLRMRWRARPKRIFMYPRRRYTHCVFFSGPAYVWGTCLTHGEVRGHVRAVVLQQT